MVNPVQCNNSALPMFIDLPINVTKNQLISSEGLTIPVFVTQDSTLSGEPNHGAGRILYFDTFNSVIDTYGADGEVFKAASAFFSQAPRPQTLAVAQVFTAPQAGLMITGIVEPLAIFQAISDGEFGVLVDGVLQDIAGINFTLDTDYTDIAATITAAIAGAVVTESAAAGIDVQFTFTSSIPGDGSSISTLQTVAVPAGTDISGILNTFLNGRAGETIDGYTPTGLTNELTLVAEAATCSGRFVYAYILDHIYMETAEQINAMIWAEGQDKAILFTDSNNPIALDAGDSTSNMLYANVSDHSRTYFEYIKDLDVYYPMYAAAMMLSTDYNAANSTKTLKFKDYPGAPTTPITETQLGVVESKRGNVFTLIGNGARTVRESTTSSDIWFLDERVDIDNFKNDLETDVYNVFLVNNKISFTPEGQALLRQGMEKTCDKYVRNGAIADRVVTDKTQPNGITTIPAYTIAFAPLNEISAGDRASRFMTGTTIVLQLSGAVHKLQINVTVQS